ncbi:MAG: hypothetical protein FWE08_06505 [Oscillospiraceae bacterium]|nr:hypothetical protein [Oscillospiraceae bacterium]
MALYDFLRDAASAAQKAKNVELFQALLDAQQQALELQTENVELRKTIEELQDSKALEEKVVRYEHGAFITFRDDERNIQYCPSCWGTDMKRIQMKRWICETFKCHACGNETNPRM